MIIQLKNDGANINLKGSKYLKGEDGYTPIKGVDYWTEEDKQEIIDSIDIDVEAAKEVYIGTEAPDADSDALIWMNPEGEGEQIDVDLTNYYTKEEVDKAIEQIEVAPEVDLSDYVKKTDIGSNTALGLVKTLSNGASYGVNINSSGILNIVGANANDIANKSHSYKPLTPNNLDYIMEVGLTTNSRTLSAEKQAKAKEWLGIGEGGQADLTNYRTLNNNVFENGVVATNGVSTMSLTPTSIACGTGAVEISATGEAHFNDIYSNNELVATQQYVDDTISQIESEGVYVGTEEPTDPDKLIWINPDGGESVGIATQQWVNEQIAAIPQPDLDDYALKTEIPDTTGFITMPEVEEKGYQTEEQVNALIEASGGSGGGGVEQSYIDEMDRLPGRWTTQYRCIKTGDTVNGATFDGYYSSMAMRASSKEEALKYLALGFPIRNENASWGSSYYYDITPDDLASIGLSWGSQLYNGNKYPISGTQTLRYYDRVYFPSNGQVYMVAKGSYYYIPKYLNRFWYDNTVSGLNATDIPAAIDELKGMIDTLNAIGVAEQGVY